MEQRLSDFLLEKVDMYGTDRAGLPSKSNQTARFYLEEMARRLIEFRELFTDGKFFLPGAGSEQIPLDLEKGFQNDPEAFEIEIDRVLSQQALENVPATVKRLARMSKLTSLQIPSDQTGVYIREAARTYAYGFMQASAAMSRAALEQALKERLGIQGVHGFISLKELRGRAVKLKILDPAMSDAMKQTVCKANSVLHEKPVSETVAFEVLIEARGLIQQIYDAHPSSQAG